MQKMILLGREVVVAEVVSSLLRHMHLQNESWGEEAFPAVTICGVVANSLASPELERCCLWWRLMFDGEEVDRLLVSGLGRCSKLQSLSCRLVR